jgi:glycosyltransferase involved in cell wall biosynthesis
MRVHFLMFNADARDGVSRAVITLANELSRTHAVELISLYRRHEGPAYRIAEGVRVSYLFDRPPVPRGSARTNASGVAGLLARGRSRLAQGRGYPNLSLLTDLALRRKLRTIHSGVIVSTRPALHLVAAGLARPGVLTVGQDHLNFESRMSEAGSMELIEAACHRGLDAFVTLTAADVVDYRRTLAGSGTRVTSIPNALSWPIGPPRDHHERIVVAAGRLVPRKGMGRLVRAFAMLADRHPDWELRIHGVGRLEGDLHRLIEASGLAGRVRLMGYTADLPEAFAKASVFASASRAEGFPMVMLEALSTGLPLVGFDCPRGPSDIIRHGENGFLVPNGDIAALSSALEEVISDDELRHRLGTQARLDATTYAPERIAARWDRLFEDLALARANRTAPVASGGTTPVSVPSV